MYDFTNDAIFKAGIIHGCEDELYLIYLNPDSSVPSWEISHINRYEVLAYLKSKEALDLEEFFDVVVNDAPHYWEVYDPENYCDLSRQYEKADFIYNRDGKILEEATFIINWAKEVE